MTESITTELRSSPPMERLPSGSDIPVNAIATTLSRSEATIYGTSKVKQMDIDTRNENEQRRHRISLLRAAIDENAQCRGDNVEDYIPKSPISEKSKVRFCNGCPVITQCLEYAIDEKIFHGVWGGSTGAQRRRIVSARNRAK
jgi:WhiB family redox-sensing transcriptional regulator